MAENESSTQKICTIDGCDRPHAARGLCKQHYRKARASGMPLAEGVKYASVCIADGCDRASEKRGYCDMHYRRMQRFGTLETVRQPPGALVIQGGGYMTQRRDGVKKLHHVLIAEASLGKELPPGVEVHHVNENRADNRPANLVVCPDRQYHMLLHARQRAQDACGNANWKKCCFCKQYDDPALMTGRATRGQLLNSFYHKACAATYQRERKAAPPSLR